MKQDWFSILKKAYINELNEDISWSVRVDINLMINDFLGTYFLVKSDSELQKSEQKAELILIDANGGDYKLIINNEKPNPNSSRIELKIVPNVNSINSKKTIDKKILILDYVYNVSSPGSIRSVSISSQLVSNRDNNLYIEEKELYTPFGYIMNERKSTFKRIIYCDINKLNVFGINIDDFDKISSLRKALEDINFIPDINIKLSLNESSYSNSNTTSVELRDSNTQESFTDRIYKEESCGTPHMHLYYKYLRSLKKVRKVKILK